MQNLGCKNNFSELNESFMSQSQRRLSALYLQAAVLRTLEELKLKDFQNNNK
jgi:hypothetical protein